MIVGLSAHRCVLFDEYFIIYIGDIVILHSPFICYLYFLFKVLFYDFNELAIIIKYFVFAKISTHETIISLDL